MMRYLLTILLIFAGFPVRNPNQDVQDFAGVVAAEKRQEISALVARVRQLTSAELAVVTVDSLHGESVDRYAYSLFNSWGLGDADRNNGVLFLIAPNDRRTRIEVGRGLEPLLTDSLCGEILDTYVVPYFKKGLINEGILAGTREIAQILIRHPEAARGIPGSTPFYVRTSRMNAIYVAAGAAAGALFLGIWAIISRRRRMYSTSFFVVATLGVAGLSAYAFYLIAGMPTIIRPIGELIGSLSMVFVALIYNTRQFLRYGSHRCRSCGTPLQLLAENEDDSKLTDTQRLEESIGSVDYDVWFCPACLKSNTETYVSAFSSFKKCEKCAHRTFHETSTTVRGASTYSTGLRRIDGDCVSCKHRTTRTEVIPRISSSSSSGSGGFGGSSGGSSSGGGSSGGGGASRGW